MEKSRAWGKKDPNNTETEADEHMDWQQQESSQLKTDIELTEKQITMGGMNSRHRFD